MVENIYGGMEFSRRKQTWGTFGKKNFYQCGKCQTLRLKNICDIYFYT